MKQHGARFTLVALTNLPLDGVSLIHRIPNISRESLSRPEFTTSVSAATGAVFLGFFLCLGFGRGCQRWGWIGGLFCCCSWVVYWAIVVCAYGESGSYALAINNDCGLSGCARRGWLGVRVVDHRLDLAEVPALDCPRPLLSCVPPAVLDLDKLGTGCNLAVNVRGELDLIAGS